MRRSDRLGMARFFWEPHEQQQRAYAESVLMRAVAGDPEKSLEWAGIIQGLGLPPDIGYLPPEGCFWVPLDKAMIIRR